MKKIFFICIASLIVSTKIVAKKIGSNTAPSRQARAFFPKTDHANIIMGFTACDKGLTLDDATTTCSYNSFFPLVGDIVLNGGALYLMRDLEFNSPLNLGAGTIDGNGFSVGFPLSTSNVDLPAQEHENIIQLQSQVDVGEIINDVSWSYDDKYLAVGLNGDNGNAEVQIYYYDGEVLTLTASKDYGATSVLSIEWQPNAYNAYNVAIGLESGTTLETLIFSFTANQLNGIDQKSINQINMLTWHPTGNWLAVGTSNNNQILVYPVTDGIFDTPITINLTGQKSVSSNGLDWNSTGTYLAVGYQMESNKQMQIFSFDGTTLTENTSLTLGAQTNVNSVKWYPNSSWLTLGINKGTERVQLYNHNPEQGTLTEITSARVGELRTVFDLAWNNDGQFLSTVKTKDIQAQEIEVFVFFNEDNSLHLINGYEIGKNVNTIAWSHQGNCLATSVDSSKLGILCLNKQSLTFKDVSLYFNSDVTVYSDIKIQGECLINCSGNILDLSHTGSIIVDSNATLILERCVIKGVAQENIRCVDDSAKIILRNTAWLQDDDVQFKKGAIQFKDNVLMGGDYVFAYQSALTSTIATKTRLELDVGFTFSYDPIAVDSKKLIEFVDKSSILAMNGATLHATTTGLQLLKGKLRVVRDSFIVAESFGDQGVTFGNQQSSNDMYVEILSGSGLIVNQGALNYRNINAASLYMVNERSLLKMNAGTQLNVYENMDNDDGIITFNNATLARLSNTNIIGSINTLGSFTQIIMS